MQSPFARMEFENYASLAPGVTEAASLLSKAINESGLNPEYLELAKIRASQVNGCAQCLGIHLNAARRIGMDPQKLDLIAVWSESGIFDAPEMAVLAWTEQLTDLAGSAISDEDYQAIHVHFTASEVAFLTAAIGMINFYNRLGSAYHFSPPRYRPGNADRAEPGNQAPTSPPAQ